MNIYVGNLPFTADDASLKVAFEAHGEVKSAQVIMDRETGRSRGFGFVEMPDATQAKAAIEGLNGTEFQGRTLNVNEARPKTGGGGGGGGSRGGGGGGFRGGDRGGDRSRRPSW